MNTSSDYRWREVSPDYRGRLQRFQCATAYDSPQPFLLHKGGKYYTPWELEVQNTIRDFRSCDSSSQWAHICVSRPDSQGDEKIYSFVWFGIINGRKHNSNGTYMIGYIARDISAKGCKIGELTLRHALRVLYEDYKNSRRQDIIGARIDPHNTSSIALFTNNGFVDTGIDQEAPDYHRFLKFGFV